MPKLSKADKRRKVSANEARRRKEVALARLRMMEADERVSVVRAALKDADQCSAARATRRASRRTSRSFRSTGVSRFRNSSQRISRPARIRAARSSECERRSFSGDVFTMEISVRHGGMLSKAERGMEVAW